MTAEPLYQLDTGRLLGALGLIAIALGLSSWQRLGLTWNLALATGRTLLQLGAVGYVLAVVFDWGNPWITLAVLLLLLTMAAIVTRNRISQKIPRLLPVVWGSLAVSLLLTLTYTIGVVIQPEALFDPRYWIPLAGGVLGHAMGSAGIAGEQLVSTLNQHRLDIETHLSLGATPQQAIAVYTRQAIRAAVLPTLNTMAIVGIVSLPGFLSGQLLGGVEPLNAAAYQTLLMLMLAFSSLVASLLVTAGIRQRCFNRAAQLILP
ncbi:MAG: iron export ABC transporter permease subunit FetB [Cyanobacteria bacterium J06639_16]